MHRRQRTVEAYAGKPTERSSARTNEVDASLCACVQEKRELLPEIAPSMLLVSNNGSTLDRRESGSVCEALSRSDLRAGLGLTE